MFIFGLVLGFIIGLVFFTLFGYFLDKKKNKKESSLLKRGLYTNRYSVDNDSNDSFEAVFEVSEIESTDTLSKVKVISVKTSRSTYLKNNNLKEMVDNSWIDTSKIMWITSKSQIRNSKIDEIIK